MNFFLVKYNITNAKLNIQKNIFLTKSEQLAIDLKNLLLKAMVKNSSLQIHIKAFEFSEDTDAAHFLTEKGGDGQYHYMIQGELSESSLTPSFSLETESTINVSDTIEGDLISVTLNEIFSLDDGKFVFRKKTKRLDYDF